MKQTAIVLVIIFVFFGQLWAQNAETDFQVTLTQDGNGAIITKYVGTARIVRIPATIQGMPVLVIGNEAFTTPRRQPNNTISYQGSPITSIMIPEGVLSILHNTFRGCTALASVTIPNTITFIGENSFSGCTALTSITIPNNVTSIGGAAFSGSGLKSITWPASVSTIAARTVGVSYVGMFTGCKNLQTVVIPEGVTKIEPNAFSGCSALTSVKISNSITSIGERAFIECTSLASINIPNTITSIGEYAFSGSGLRSITWPTGVSTIDTRMFSSCKSLQTVEISEGVTSIAELAFEGCIALTSVTLPSTIRSIGVGAFLNCSSLATVIIPESITRIEFGGDTLPSMMYSIGYPFQGCKNLSLVSQAALRRVGYTRF